MKKLMTLAAVVCATLFANAASVNWSISGSADTVDYKIYIVGAISDAWTSVADLATAASEYGAGGAGIIVKQGRAYGVAGSLASDNITKTSGDAFFVIVSGDDASDYYYVKADLSALSYEGVETPPGEYATTAADLLAGTHGSFQSIPEPTGAMLVLLGVAGLALRRKQK